jgi:ATP/maltotriose-dependent transcriptional regulator MalT
MAEHSISARIQDGGGCNTDPPLRSDINISNSAFCLWGNADSSYSSQHASWDLERHVSEVSLLGKVRRNLTGADFAEIRRDVRRARRFLLKWQLSEALELLDRIECALGDLPSSVARRVHAETNSLRAMGAALQDDSLSALHFALMVSRDNDVSPGACSAASAVGRFAHWRLRDFDGFYSVPRHRPTVILSKRHAMAAVINLCVEAAVELEQLRLSAAKRLALDALELAQTVCKSNGGLPALPASIVAQVLYEQGSLDEAEACIRGRLRVINTSGVLECALRAYHVLARIAMHRGRDVFAASILQEAEELGERRGWARLTAMSMCERVDLLLRHGRIKEAELSAERLDRLVARYPSRASGTDSDVQSYRRIAYARLALTSAATADTVETLRQLHREAVRARDLYSALRLAVQLAASLDLVGESDEADSLFLRVLSLGCFAGLYQVFVDGGREIDSLLVRAYDHAHPPGAAFRELVPYIGSLVALKQTCGTRRLVERARIRSSAILSVRECDILTMVGRGLSNKRIARALTIAPETVKSHVKRIFIKLEVKTRAEAVSRAGAQGPLPLRTGKSWT